VDHKNSFLNENVELNWNKIPDFYALTGVKEVLLSPTSTDCLFFGEDYNDIIIYDPLNNLVKRKLSNYSNKAFSALFLDDQLLISSTGSTSFIDLETGQDIWIKSPPTGGETVYDLQIEKDTTVVIPSRKMRTSAIVSHDKKRIALVNVNNEIEIIDSESNTQNVIIRSFNDKEIRLLFSKNDSILFSWKYEDTILYAWNAYNGDLISKMVHFDQINDVNVCSHKDIVISTAGLFDNSVGLVWYVPTGELADYYQIATGVNNFGFYDDCQYVYVSDGSDSLNVYTIMHDVVVEDELEKDFSLPILTDVNTGHVFVTKEKEEFKRFDLFLHDVVNQKKELVIELIGYPQEMVQSPDGDYLAVTYFDNSLELINLTGTPSVFWRKINHLDNINSIDFSDDSQTIATASMDGSVILYETETGESIIQRFQFDTKGKSWLHIHPSGLFDASPEAMELMYWTKGLEVIDFSQLKDRYWLPGLWEKVMKGEKLPDVRDMNELKLQPEVELNNITDESVTVQLTKREGGYGKVSLFVNGKEAIKDIRPSNMNFTLQEQTITVSIKDHPYLLDGENDITVKASSEDGFVQGRGSKGKAIVKKKEVKQPQFFGVIVGVGDYANDQLNLKYTVNDAEAISRSEIKLSTALPEPQASIIITCFNAGISFNQSTHSDVDMVFFSLITESL